MTIPTNITANGRFAKVPASQKCTLAVDVFVSCERLERVPFIRDQYSLRLRPGGRCGSACTVYLQYAKYAKCVYNLT